MAERTFQKKRTIQNRCNIQNRHTMQSKSMQTNNSANASADFSAGTSNPDEISHPTDSSNQNIDDTQAVHSKSSVLVHGTSSDDKSSAYDDKNSANYDEPSVHTDGSDETDGTNEKTADSAVEEDAVEGRAKDTAADAVENANEHVLENTAESVVEDVVEDADESVVKVVENTADNAAGDEVEMAENRADGTVEVAENLAENLAEDATESSMRSATNSSCQFDVSLKVLEWVEEQIQNANVSKETRDEIQAWIKGTRQPVFSKIRQISRETGIPLGYFFLKKPPIEDISFMSWTSSQEVSSWPPSRNLIEVYHDMRMVQDWMQSFLINELASPIEYFNTDLSECLQDYWKTSLNEYLNEYVNDFVNDYVGKLPVDTGLDANKSTYQSCDYLTACNFNSGLDSNGLDSNTACLSNCLSNSCLDDSTARVSNCLSNSGLGDDTTNVSNSSNSRDANTVGSLESIRLLSTGLLSNELISNELISEGLLSTPHDPHDTAQSKKSCIHSCERIAEQLRKILDLPTDWNAAYEVSEGAFNQLRQAISNTGTLVMMSGSAGNAYDDKLLDISGNLPIYKQDVSSDIGKVLEHGIGNKQGSASSLTLNEEIDSVSKDTLCHILDGSLRHTLDTEDTEQSRKPCFVRDRGLDIKEFRAFCFADEYAPLIFINANASVEERLFALVYEFMHVCLGKNSVFNAQDVWLDYAQVRADGSFQWQKPENTAHSKSDGDLFSHEMMGIRAAFDIGKSKLALYGLCFDNSNIESKNEVALGKAFYCEKFKNNKLYLDIDVEGLCREVTYEFLIPHRVLLAEWNNCIQNCAPQQNCTPQDAVLKLARIFKTGVIALASRLCHSHLITPEVYQAIVQSNVPCLKEYSAVTSSASLTSSASSVKSSIKSTQDVGHTVEQSCEDRHTAELICDKEGNRELQNSQQQNCESQNHQQQNREAQNSQPHNREEGSGEQPNCEVLNSKAGNSDVQNCKQQNTVTGNSEQQSSEPQIKESIHAALARKCCNAGHIEYVGYYAKQFMQGLVIDLKLECQPLFIKSKGILSHPTETDTNQTGVNSNQLATNSHIAPAVLNFGNNDQTANAPEDLVKGNSRGSSGLQSVSEPESKTRGAGADNHVQSNNHHTELTELTELTEAASNQTAINQDNQEARADSVSHPSTTTSLSTAASGLESGGTSGSLSDSESAVVSDSSSCLAPSAVSGASSDLASSSSVSSVSAVSDVLDVSDLLDEPDVLDNELSLSDLATAATPVSDVASVESVVATPVSDAVSVDLVLDAETLAASSASGTIPVSNSPQESSVSSALTDNEKSEAAVLILADDDSNIARVLAESRINTDDTSRVNTDSASDEPSLDEVRYDVSDALNDAMHAMQAMQTGDTLELSSTWDAYGSSEKQDVVANVGDMTLQKSKVEFSAECLAAANRLDKHFLNALISSVQEGKTLYTDAFRLTGVDRVVFSELIKFMCMEDE